MIPRSIPTKYKGIQFRSQLEARWAVFFDALEINWQYEPEGYLLETPEGTVAYRPDFLICVHQDCMTHCFVEIKGLPPTPEEIFKARELAVQSGYAVFIFSGPPLDIIFPSSENGQKFGSNGFDECGYVFAECSKCDLIGICYGGYTNELSCPHDTGRGYHSPRIKAAAEQARGFSGWKPKN